MKPLVSKMEAYFETEVSTLWQIVTNNEDYKWRSDIKKLIKDEDGNSWLEYYDDKNFTSFQLKQKVENSLYEFEMTNKLFTGSWKGKFISCEGGCKLEFTEKLHINNPIIRVAAYFLWDLSKIQNKYIEDLRNKLLLEKKVG